MPAPAAVQTGHPAGSRLGCARGHGRGPAAAVVGATVVVPDQAPASQVDAQVVGVAGRGHGLGQVDDLALVEGDQGRVEALHPVPLPVGDDLVDPVLGVGLDDAAL